MPRNTSASPMDYPSWRENLPYDYPNLNDYRRVVGNYLLFTDTFINRPPKDTTEANGALRIGVRVYKLAMEDPDYQPPKPDMDAQGLKRRIAQNVHWIANNSEFVGSMKKSRHMGPHRAHELMENAKLVRDQVSEQEWEIIRDLCLSHGRDLLEQMGDFSRIDHEFVSGKMTLLSQFVAAFPEDFPSELPPKLEEMKKYSAMSQTSIESDCEDETIVDGRPVKEWVRYLCPNLHSDFTLIHHNLGIHPGYMGIMLLRMALLAADTVEAGGDPTVYCYHFPEMMNAFNRLRLWDGRISFPNCKDWVEYLYGLSEFLIPLSAAQTACGRDTAGLASLMEREIFGHLDWIQQNQTGEKEGSFGDFSEGEWGHDSRDAGALMLSHSIHLRCVPAYAGIGNADELERRGRGVFYSPEGRFIHVKGKHRYASWGWWVRGHPHGTVAPKGGGFGSHLPSFHVRSLCSGFEGNEQWPRPAFDGERMIKVTPIGEEGFTVVHCDTHTNQLTEQIAIAALPDDRTVVYLSRLVYNGTESVPNFTVHGALNYTFLYREFSGNTRTIHYDGGAADVESFDKRGTSWVNLDDMLGIVGLYGSDSFFVGNIGEHIRHRLNWQTTGIVQYPRIGQVDLLPDKMVYDVGVAFLADIDGDQTQQADKEHWLKVLCSDKEGLKIIGVRGADGKTYLIGMNFSEDSRAWNAELSSFPPEFCKLSGEKSGFSVDESMLILQIAPYDLLLIQSVP